MKKTNPNKGKIMTRIDVNWHELAKKRSPKRKLLTEDWRQWTVECLSIRPNQTKIKKILHLIRPHVTTATKLNS